MKNVIIKAILLVLLVIGSSLGTFLVLDSFGYLNLISKTPLTITLKDATKPFDNIPLYPNGVLSDNDPNGYTLDGELRDGHTLEVTYLNSITNVGETTCDANAIIRDENNRNVTSSYDIDIIPSTLTITKRQVNIILVDTKMEYTGRDLIPDNFRIDTELPEGHKLYTIVTPISTTGLMEKCNVKAQVINQLGFEVTSNYDLSYDTEIEIEITKRALSLSLDTQTKTYDGEEIKLKQNDFLITSGSLAEGDRAEFSIKNVDGDITEMKDAGTYNVSIIMKVYNEENTDVTSFYQYDENDSFRFEILKKEETIQLPVLIKTYDTLSFLDELESELSLLTNELLLPAGKIIELSDAGVMEVEKFKNVKYNKSTRQVDKFELKEEYFNPIETDNVKYKFNTGYLTINPKEATVYLGDITKGYDGEKFSIDDITTSLYISGIIDTDEDGNIKEWDKLFKLEEDGLPKQINATKNQIKYTIELSESNDLHNYKLKYESGNLFIRQLETTITLNNSIVDSSYKDKYLNDEYNVYSNEANFAPSYSISGDSYNVRFNTKRVSTLLDTTDSTIYRITVDKIYCGDSEVLYIKPAGQINANNYNDFIPYINYLKENKSDDAKVTNSSLELESFDMSKLSGTPDASSLSDLNKYIKFLENNQENYPNVFASINFAELEFKENQEETINLKYSVKSITKTFDGSGIRNNSIEYEILDNDYKDDYKLEFELSDSLKEQTSVCNQIPITFKNITVKKVSDNSVCENVNLILASSPTLTISKLQTTLYIDSSFTTYRPIIGSEFKIPSRYVYLANDKTEYINGDIFTFEITSLDSIPSSGKGFVRVTGIKVYDEDGKDVTNCFQITYNENASIEYIFSSIPFHFVIDDYTLSVSDFKMVYDLMDDNGDEYNLGLSLFRITSGSLALGDSIEDIEISYKRGNETGSLDDILDDILEHGSESEYIGTKCILYVEDITTSQASYDYVCDKYGILTITL